MENEKVMPVGELGIIGMQGCEELMQSVDQYISSWRKERAIQNPLMGLGDHWKETYKIEAMCPRFGTGEAKGLIKQSVRGDDLFIICDVFNYGVAYNMYGKEIPMSPDDHFCDLKRVIAAAGGKARRITVIMPMLYEGRQHKRSSRESLDCALALQELVNMGVDNIITFDAHDPRVQNAIPLRGFENVHPNYQMIKKIVKTVPDIKLTDPCQTMIVSPDEGGMSRCIYYSSVLGLELGMFYKRRDYSTIVNGRNPIVCHEFLGDNVEGKDVIIVDDMISSGDSIIDICKQLQEMKAKRVFVFASFGLFVEGIERFDEAYEQGMLNKVFTTNLIYRTPELRERPWYSEVDMSKYIALIIDTLNYDKSISELLNPVNRIKNFLNKINNN